MTSVTVKNIEAGPAKVKFHYSICTFLFTDPVFFHLILYDQWKWGWKSKLDHTDTTQIDLCLDMDTNILNIKGVSV